MIAYQTFHQIRQLCDQEKLSVAQIAAALQLDERTVGKWIATKTYQPRAGTQRSSKLDPHKGAIVRLLATHPFTAQQLLQRLRDQGYTGGYSILKDYVRAVRPPRQPAFLKLHFAPGQCAQVDWGSAGFLTVGRTRRRLSFFVMVLCYMRRVLLTLSALQLMLTKNPKGLEASIKSPEPSAAWLRAARTLWLIFERQTRRVYGIAVERLKILFIESQYR